MAVFGINREKVDVKPGLLHQLGHLLLVLNRIEQVIGNGNADDLRFDPAKRLLDAVTPATDVTSYKKPSLPQQKRGCIRP